MTETVVHVTTLEQWKSVLDVWFEQGHKWNSNNKDSQQGRFKNYYYEAFRDGCRQLAVSDNKSIYFYGRNRYKGKTIEYSEFMSQKGKTMAKETYYVTQKQLDFLNTMYEELYSLDELLNRHTEAKVRFYDFSIPEGNAVLRYLGGDTSIEFKVKEKLYRLWRIDDNGDRVYMKFSYGTPDWTSASYAFTAPLEEIKKHKTISWEIEEVK